MSLLHSIPFRHAIHFLACIILDLISLSSVPLVSKITPESYHHIRKKDQYMFLEALRCLSKWIRSEILVGLMM